MKVVRTFFLAVPQLILPQKMLDPHLYLFPLYEKNTETQDSECFIRVNAFRAEKERLKIFLFSYLRHFWPRVSGFSESVSPKIF